MGEFFAVNVFIMILTECSKSVTPVSVFDICTRMELEASNFRPAYECFFLCVANITTLVIPIEPEDLYTSYLACIFN